MIDRIRPESMKKKCYLCAKFLNLIVVFAIIVGQSPQPIAAKDRVGRTTYQVNGRDNDFISRAFADLRATLKDLKRSLEIETRETDFLRETLAKCELCGKRATLVTSGCQTNPCFASVVCTDLANGGYRCGPCPKGYTGDGADCHRLVTCRNRPCFQGVTCYEDETQGYRCGDCPTGYTGNGISCASNVKCADTPCYTGVACAEYSEPPGYRCGACPHGTTGDGSTCTADIEEYEMATPCASPSFRCMPCPPGYTGKQVQRYGVVRTQRRSQPVFGMLTIKKCSLNQTISAAEKSQ